MQNAHFISKKGPGLKRTFNWEPPDVGLAPTGVLRVPPIPHFNWRTVPSSQTPSLLALSFPLPPTSLGSFCKAPGEGGPSWWGGGGVLGRKGWRGGASKRHLGAKPTSGGTRFKLGRVSFPLPKISSDPERQKPAN